MNELSPVVRIPLENNENKLSGDDSGYRGVPSQEGGEPMVALLDNTNMVVRPVYAGHNPVDGQINTSSCLPGARETMYVRKAVAQCLERAANFIAERSNYRLIVVDGFRNYQTQAAGFSQLFMQSLRESRGDIAVYDALISSDGIFSFVDIDMAKVADNSLSTAEFVSLAQQVNGDPTPEQIRKEMLTGAANVALYQQLTGQDFGLIDMAYWGEKLNIHGADLFCFNNNAHTGGGAVDVLLGEEREIDGHVTWVPVNHVPFDHMGPESAIDFLENEENWHLYRKVAKKAGAIRAYLISTNIDPDNISNKQFEKWRDAIRLLTNTMTGIGATYYCSENWHFNVSNLVLNPKTKKIEYIGNCSSIQKNTGNSCHAILIHGPKGIQTFTGIGAHQMLNLY